MTQLNVDVFADGADIEQMKAAYKNKEVDGFTTNPSLMAKAGVTDYKAFAEEAVREIPDASISFEVFSDDLDTMEKEAEILKQYGDNVFVKIPTESTIELIKKLSADHVRLNVTAVYTIEQVKAITEAVTEGVPTYISVFAGRIADTGVDPLPLMKESVKVAHSKMVLNYYGQVAVKCSMLSKLMKLAPILSLVQQMLSRKLTIILDAILMNCQWIQFKDLQKILKVLDYQYYKITISNYDQPSLRLQTCLRLGFSVI